MKVPIKHLEKSDWKEVYFWYQLLYGKKTPMMNLNPSMEYVYKPLERKSCMSQSVYFNFNDGFILAADTASYNFKTKEKGHIHKIFYTPKQVCLILGTVPNVESIKQCFELWGENEFNITLSHIDALSCFYKKELPLETNQSDIYIWDYSKEPICSYLIHLAPNNEDYFKMLNSNKNFFDPFAPTEGFYGIYQEELSRNYTLLNLSHGPNTLNQAKDIAIDLLNQAIEIDKKKR